MKGVFLCRGTRLEFHRGCRAHGITLLLLASLCARVASATTLLVSNNNDSGPGSLRQAVLDNLGGGTIVFSNVVTGTITLTSGELLVSNSVAIIGPGANVLSVNGNHAGTVFHVIGTSANISGLTIANGGTGTTGAGLYLDSGFVLLHECAISTNSALEGAGIYELGGNLTVSNCSVVANQAVSLGAGIYAGGGSLTLINSTIAGNTTTQNLSFGGGLFVGSGVLATILNCTISGNYSLNNLSGGAGITVIGSGNAYLRNTIVAGNTAANHPDCDGAFVSEGYNLIGITDGSTGWGGLGDQTGNLTSPINPLLGALQYNGGATMTMALSRGSSAIDQGLTAPGVTVDQRGRPRPYDDPSITNAIFGDGTDIGAYEVNPLTLVVTNKNDSGPGSLRQALADAGGTDGDTITFAPSLTGNILLTSGELAVAKTLTVAGPGQRLLALNGNGLSRVLHVLANGNVNIVNLTITNGYNATDIIGGAGIRNDGFMGVLVCAIVGNRAQYYGGGIANQGYLGMSDSLVSGNTIFSQDGAGLYTDAGTVTIFNSTFSQNTLGQSGSTPGRGGGIQNDGATVNVYDSTFYGNGGPYCLGGGLNNGGTLTLTSCTIAGNQASNGGGVNSGNVSTTVRNTIIADNNASNLGPDCWNAFTSSGYNLIGKTDGSTGFGNGLNHDLAGTVASPLHPLLGPLQYNGGLTPTMALLPGSPAIDKGDASHLGIDQRRFIRTWDDPAVANASDGTDIGAFEASPLPTLSLVRIPGGATLYWPTNGIGFEILSTTNLSASGAWTPLELTNIQFDGTRSFMNLETFGQRFFRMSAPGP